MTAHNTESENVMRFDNPSGDKILCPDGVHNGVLAAVYYLGLQPGFNQGEARGKYAMIFQTDQIIRGGKFDGEPYLCSAIVSATVFDRSKMREIIRALLGRDLTTEEISKGTFDLNSLVGQPCMIEVVHVIKNGVHSPHIERVSRHIAACPRLTAKPLNKVPDWVDRIRERRLDNGKVNKNASDPSPARPVQGVSETEMEYLV